MAPRGQDWRRKPWWPAFRTSGLYAALAFLWIYSSDALLGMIFRDPAEITRFSTIKGTAFVLLTALMLFLDRLAGERASRRQRRVTEESETKFRSLIEHAPVGIVVADNRGKIIQANAAAGELTGFAHGELEQGEIWPLAVPETREEVLADLRRLRELGHLHTVLPSLRKDGQQVSLDISAARIRSDLYIGFIRDVTEQRRASEALRASEQRFRLLTEEAPLGIALQGPDRGFRYLNPRLVELVGYDLAEVPTWERWLARAYPDPALRAAVMADWEEDFGHHQESEHTHARVTSVTCKDGTVKSINIRSRCLADGGWLMTFEDETLRKRAEEATRAASAERLARLEAASLARVVPWSMDEHGWMQWGESLEAVFQWPTGPTRRHLGWPWDRLHPDDHLRLRIALAQADQGQVSSFECRMSRLDGHWLWTRWTLAGERGQYHGAVQDIHDQHEVQAQLLQTQKLESMGTLMGGITHDFNNLLMAILGFSELLLQDEKLSAANRHAMETIFKAASRGRSLIDQFLGFSRKLPARRVQANLNSVAEEASRLLRHALSNRVELRLQLAPKLPDTHFDTSQLHQVLMNLALNARDAIQDQGTITLRTSLAEVGHDQGAAHGRPQGTYVLLEVEDDGMGIPPATLHRIFEPFFTTKGTKGTGLGLSMVHGIIMEHGGILECRSEVGRGTAMRIYLPLMATAKETPLEGAGPARAKNILVLTAQASLREELAGILGLLGQASTSTPTPEATLERLGRDPWDLLILEPEALPQPPGFLQALQDMEWQGGIVSVGSRLDPSFQHRTAGHLARNFTLFDMVEILDRLPQDDLPHAAHPSS